MGPSSKPQPLVSVVIPSYNRAHVVGRAVESVLGQTYAHLEVVVVDDGSTDDTEQVVRSLSDERVKLLLHDVNRGASAARNTGIGAAAGELIAFLDSDDEWLPDKLERQVGILACSPHDVGVVYGGYELFDDESERTVRREYPSRRGHVFLEMLKEDFVGSPTPLVRKECFQRVGLFDTGLRFGEDWDMWLRVARYYRFDFVGGVVARFHISEHQITKDSIGALRDLSKFWGKYHDELATHPPIHAHHLKWAAQRYLMEGQYAVARSHFGRAVRVRPADLRLYMHLLVASTVPWLYRSLWNTQFMLRLRDRVYRGTNERAEARHECADNEES